MVHFWSNSCLRNEILERLERVFCDLRSSNKVSNATTWWWLECAIQFCYPRYDGIWNLRKWNVRVWWYQFLWLFLLKNTVISTTFRNILQIMITGKLSVYSTIEFNFTVLEHNGGNFYDKKRFSEVWSRSPSERLFQIQKSLLRIKKNIWNNKKNYFEIILG